MGIWPKAASPGFDRDLLAGGTQAGEARLTTSSDSVIQMERTWFEGRAATICVRGRPSSAHSSWAEFGVRRRLCSASLTASSQSGSPNHAAARQRTATLR